MSRMAAALLLFLAATAVSAQDENVVIVGGEAAAPTTILEAAAASNETTIGIVALNSSVLLADAVRNSSTAVTAFLPNDQAFQTFLETANITAEDLLANTTVLDVILAYHVVPAVVPSAALNATQTVSTLLDPTAVLNITKSDNGSVTVVGGSPSNVAQVVLADVQAGDSIIHVINAVLVPSQEVLDRVYNGTGLNFNGSGVNGTGLLGGSLITPVTMMLDTVATNTSTNGSDDSTTTGSDRASSDNCSGFKGGKTAEQVTDADLKLYDDSNSADVAELQRLCICLYSPADCAIGGGRRLLRAAPFVQRVRW